MLKYWLENEKLEVLNSYATQKCHEMLLSSLRLLRGLVVLTREDGLAKHTYKAVAENLCNSKLCPSDDKYMQRVSVSGESLSTVPIELKCNLCRKVPKGSSKVA